MMKTSDSDQSLVPSSGAESPPGGTRPKLFRRKLIVDPEAQYIYIVYVILLGCLFVSFDIITSILWRMMTNSVGPQAPIPPVNLGFTIIAIACLGALVILVAVFAANVVSNRVVGPVWRLNKNMKEFLVTGEVKPIAFRDKDQFQELAANYNKLLEQVAELKRRCNEQGSAK